MQKAPALRRGFLVLVLFVFPDTINSDGNEDAEQDEKGQKNVANGLPHWVGYFPVLLLAEGQSARCAPG
jgi:hypothetical protein